VGAAGGAVTYYDKHLVDCGVKDVELSSLRSFCGAFAPSLRLSATLRMTRR